MADNPKPKTQRAKQAGISTNKHTHTHLHPLRALISAMSALVYTSPLAITGMFTAWCIMAKHHVSAGRTAVSASRWRHLEITQAGECRCA